MGENVCNFYKIRVQWGFLFPSYLGLGSGPSKLEISASIRLKWELLRIPSNTRSIVEYRNLGLCVTFTNTIAGNKTQNSMSYLKTSIKNN